jgi:hypothetical protein
MYSDPAFNIFDGAALLPSEYTKFFPCRLHPGRLHDLNHTAFEKIDIEVSKQCEAVKEIQSLQYVISYGN